MQVESKIVIYRNKVTIYYKHVKAFRYNTGVSVLDEKSFNTKQQLLKGELAKHNEYIWNLKRSVDRIILDGINSNVTNRVDYLNSKFNKQKQLVDAEVAYDGLDIIELYKKFYKDEYENNNDIAKRTKETWKSGITHFENFINSQSKYKKLNDIDSSFVATVQKYFTQQLNEDGTKPKYTKQTIKKNVFIFRRLLKHNQNKIGRDIVNDNFDTKIVTSNKTAIVTFTDKEFEAIKNYKTDILKEQMCIDVCVFLCCTGLNISDMHQIQKEFIDETNTLRLSRNKSKNDCVIPLNDISLNILKKYNYNMCLFNQNIFNLWLKKVLKKMDIFNTKISFKSSHTDLFEVDYKYNKITSNSCRKYFITKCIEMNLPLNSIIEMIGHRNLNRLKYYMDINKKTEVARNVLNMF